MNAYRIRAEMKKMNKKDLFKLTWQQKKRWCNIGACECAFLVEYRGFNFCLTELLGQGCSPPSEPEDQIEAIGEMEHGKESRRLLKLVVAEKE